MSHNFWNSLLAAHAHALNTPNRMTKPVMSRPAEPTNGETVRYRGWECCYHVEAASWGCYGWVAYLGGPDLDCIQASGSTWDELLDEIDEHHMTEAGQ